LLKLVMLDEANRSRRIDPPRWGLSRGCYATISLGLLAENMIDAYNSVPLKLYFSGFLIEELNPIGVAAPNAPIQTITRILPTFVLFAVTGSGSKNIRRRH